MLISICIPRKTTAPTTTNCAKRFFVLAKPKILTIKIEYKITKSIEPKKPKLSAIDAKIKSLSASGRKRFYFCVDCRKLRLFRLNAFGYFVFNFNCQDFGFCQNKESFCTIGSCGSRGFSGYTNAY